jgi:hypothetical protein
MTQDQRQKSVAFADELLRDAFDALESGTSEEKRLHHAISRAMDVLKLDPMGGTKIQKALWPQHYIRKYAIDNLWKRDLPDGWRLAYTLKGTQTQLVAMLLEWFSHPDYERRFNY